MLITQIVNVVQGLYSTSTPPAIDGAIEGSWTGYPANPITKGYNNPPDLAATAAVKPGSK